MAAAALGISPQRIPGSYKKLGSIAMFRSWSLDREIEERLAEFLMRLDKSIKGVLILEASEGEQRRPRVLAEYGSLGATVHRELGVDFIFDPRRIMFSPGNLGERTHLRDVCKEGETVLDMFACIGNYSLPAAKAKNLTVIAIEWNNEAVEYLRQTVKYNGLADRFEIHEADCREVEPTHKVDRVIMGYFEVNKSHIEAVPRWLKDQAVLHIAALCTRGTVPKISKMVNEVMQTHGYAVNQERVRNVKSFNPKFMHVTIDMEVSRLGVQSN